MMESLLSWSISGLVGILLLTFLSALVSLSRLPIGHRPLVRRFDRFGRLEGLGENPDYHENPSEVEDDTPAGAGGLPDQVGSAGSRGETPGAR
jgi:hypothetical protein